MLSLIKPFFSFWLSTLFVLLEFVNGLFEVILDGKVLVVFWADGVFYFYFLTI